MSKIDRGYMKLLFAKYVTTMVTKQGAAVSMKAFPFEFRFRQVINIAIYLLGFYAPWERYTSLSLGARSWWLLLAGIPARQGWLSFVAASRLVLAIACIFAVLAGYLRVWAASYLGTTVVHSAAMQGTHVVADGPYRHVRNPLYLGLFFNLCALSILMPPTGALVAIVLLGIAELRLISAEEAFLGKKLGGLYQAYCAAVPRLFPTLQPRVAPASDRPSFVSGALSEVFVIGCALTLLLFGARFNTTLLIRGILISFGASLVCGALLPRSRPDRTL